MKRYKYQQVTADNRDNLSMRETKAQTGTKMGHRNDKSPATRRVYVTRYPPKSEGLTGQHQITPVARGISKRRR